MDPRILGVLPVALAAAAAGVVLMSWGRTLLGLLVFVLALLLTMFAAGAGLPRPAVVPRPGEEEQY